MNQPNPQDKNQKDQRRFKNWQYKYLTLCAKKGNEGIKRWNKWRENHLSTKILLEGADLTNLFLQNVNLGSGCPLNPRRRVYYGIGSSNTVRLKGASFDFSDIKGGRFGLADLRNSNFMDAKLESAYFGGSNLRGAYFLHAIVDSSTLIWECPVSRFCKKGTFTDFTGVPLENITIDDKTKELLKYNVRRMNWEKWYVGDKDKKPFRKIETKWEKLVRIWRVSLRLVVTYPIRVFWWISDYGLSTKRIIYTFIISSLIFAAIYANCVCWSPPGIVSNLAIESHLPIWHYFLLLIIRPVYFSVVTMTTLGFGDIYANSQSIWGHILLSLQVILGYVLLGALVTRFAVLFTAGGPAGKFSDDK
jgi:hypothetical protein